MLIVSIEIICTTGVMEKRLKKDQEKKHKIGYRDHS